jgi:uncharacterized protein YigA (DUF484 family)
VTGGFEHEADRVNVDLYAQVKVVLAASAHDTVEAVDGVWETELCLEQGLHLGLVGQVRFPGHDALGLCALGQLWLDNVGEDEVHIRRLGVVQQRLGELGRSASGRNVATATHDASEPAAGTGDEDDVLVGRFRDGHGCSGRR